MTERRCREGKRIHTRSVSEYVLYGMDEEGKGTVGKEDRAKREGKGRKAVLESY